MRFLITAANAEGERSWVEEYIDEASARAGAAARGYRVLAIRPYAHAGAASPAGAITASKPAAWYACIIAMALCLAGAAWAVYSAAPQDMHFAAAERAFDNYRRALAGLPSLADIPSRTPWNLLLLIAAGNSLFGAVIFGALAAIVRRVDEMARRST